MTSVGNPHCHGAVLLTGQLAELIFGREKTIIRTSGTRETIMHNAGKSSLFFLSACFVCLGMSFPAKAAAEGTARDMLGLFINLSDKDSVTELREVDSSLVVNITNLESGMQRVENVPVNTFQRRKILDAYQEQKGSAGESKAGTAPVSPAAAKKDISAQRRNHLGYVTGQTALSYYVYSLVWPIGFEMETKNATAVSMITLPVAFFSHYLLQKKYPLHDAHISGINYLTASSLALTYSVPYAIVSNDGMWDAFRASAIASMATYPLGIYLGYGMGTRNEDNAGRIDLKSVLAWSGYALGLTSPMIYMSEDFEGETVRRLAFSSAIISFLVGHFCGNLYQPGSTIPRGNPAGIAASGFLGFALGGTLDAWIEPDNLTAAVGIPWVGYLGGLLTGMNVFKHRSDLKERGTYNSLGMAAGTAAGIGVCLLTEPEDIGPYVTILTAGAFAGYFLTNSLTRDLVEGSDVRESASPFEVRLALAPEARVRRYRGMPQYTEYSIRPVTVNF